MPIDPHRRAEITAAIAVIVHPEAPLPRNTARLLTVMFPSEDVCRRSLETIATEGFTRKILPKMLRSLIEAGLLGRARQCGVESLCS